MPCIEPAARHRVRNRRQLLTVLPALAAGCGAAPGRPLTTTLAVVPVIRSSSLRAVRVIGVSVALRSKVDTMQQALAQGGLIGARPGLPDCLGPFAPWVPPGRPKVLSAEALP